MKRNKCGCQVLEPYGIVHSCADHDDECLCQYLIEGNEHSVCMLCQARASSPVNDSKAG